MRTKEDRNWKGYIYILYIKMKTWQQQNLYIYMRYTMWENRGHALHLYSVFYYDFPIVAYNSLPPCLPLSFKKIPNLKKNTHMYKKI